VVYNQIKVVMVFLEAMVVIIMVAVEWDQDLDNMEVVMVQVVMEEILMG
jgi:hypothetical protein